MSWQGIQGHDDVVEQFRRAIQGGRLASTFLFVGPAGAGKRSLADKLAQTLLCEVRPPAAMDPCDHCSACQQVLAGTHPDFHVVRKPKDRNVIPVELFIGDGSHRMREGLCHDIALKPFRGGRKIAIIDDADHLNQEGANCLLKTLEEPPPQSVLILIGTSEQKQLPTIRSRCQIVRFSPLSQETVAQLLLETKSTDDPRLAGELAQLADGSITNALQLIDPAVREFRDQLCQQLASPPWRHGELAKLVTSFVEAGGKEGTAKRARLRQAIHFAIDVYRQLIARLHGRPTAGDEVLTRSTNSLSHHWPSGDSGAAECIDLCLNVLTDVDSNANLATLVDWWLDELATVTRTGRMRLV